MNMQPLPSTIWEINRLDDEYKKIIYSSLIPEWAFTEFQIDPVSLRIAGQPALDFRFPPGSRAFEISLRANPQDRDPVLYLHATDTFNNQILVLLIMVNDPNATRYDTDITPDSKQTNFGTAQRNTEAELAAMQNGLSPGQVRRGLRSFKTLVPIFENFVQRMGRDIFFIEPLAYHNAIIFERYGFSYVRGLQTMHAIHQSFLEGGDAYSQLLNSQNPFRSMEAVFSIRMRSWAIHDGILGHPFTGFQMYKRIGYHANISTFPNARW